MKTAGCVRVWVRVVPGLFIFQTESPNGGQRFIQGFAKIGHACGAEPIPFFEMFGEFPVDVVVRGLHVAAQVALARNDEAHVERWRQNAGVVPVNFGLGVQCRVNRAMGCSWIPISVLRDQLGPVTQMQRRVGPCRRGSCRGDRG